MKFSLGILAYLVIALVLVWGISLLVHGRPWVFILGFLAYAAAFIRFGCLPKKHH